MNDGELEHQTLSKMHPESSKLLWAGLLVLVGLFLLFAWPSITLLTKIYTTIEGLSHAFMVPLVSGYATYQLWREARYKAFKPSWIGVPLLALGIVVTLFGYWHYIALFKSLFGVAFILCAGLLLCVVGAYIICGGLTTLRVFGFPLIYSIFLVPFPVSVTHFLTMKLRHIVSAISEDILSGLGLMVFREGNVLHLASASLGIADACSGINSFWMLVSGAALMAYIMKLRLNEAVFLSLITLPVSVIMNVARVVVTAFLVSYFGAEFAEGWRHELCGWLSFVGGLVMIMGLGCMFSSQDPTASKRSADTPPEAGLSLDAPPRAKKISLMVGVGLLLSMGAVGNHIIRFHYVIQADQRKSDFRKQLCDFPDQIGFFRKVRDRELEEIFQDVLQADDSLLCYYTNGNNEIIEVRIFYWKPLSARNPGEDLGSRKLAIGAQRHYPDNCFPSWGYQRIREYDDDLKIPGLTRVSASVRLFEKAGRQQCIVFWYRNERDLIPLTSRDSFKRAQELFNSWKQPLVENESQYVVTLIVGVDRSYEAARAIALRFAEDLARILPEYGIEL